MNLRDAVKIAKGCHDYGGGYQNDHDSKIYHHGIQTVINALEHAEAHGLNEFQIRTLHGIGSRKND